MSRSIRVRKIDLVKQAVSKIAQELYRIGRNREQYRYNNSQGFMYVALIQLVNDVTFVGHLAGPGFLTRGVSLSIRFKVTQNSHGFEQITIVSRDRLTSYEESILLVKHALNGFLKELPKKPYVFDTGLNKDNWHGYYLTYSGKDNKIREDFDSIFDQAVTENYFPENFRETCRLFGFNIKKEIRNTAQTNIEFLISL